MFYKPIYTHVENCDYNKVLEYYNGWIIMVLSYNKNPKYEFNNIHALVLEGM